jgi:hypothetical protein
MIFGIFIFFGIVYVISPLIWLFLQKKRIKSWKEKISENYYLINSSETVCSCHLIILFQLLNID